MTTKTGTVKRFLTVYGVITVGLVIGTVIVTPIFKPDLSISHAVREMIIAGIAMGWSPAIVLTAQDRLQAGGTGRRVGCWVVGAVVTALLTIVLFAVFVTVWAGGGVRMFKTLVEVSVKSPVVIWEASELGRLIAVVSALVSGVSVAVIGRWLSEKTE